MPDKGQSQLEPILQGCRQMVPYGLRRLEGWTDLLIFAENLATWQHLLKEDDVRGYVCLVYMVQPFAILSAAWSHVGDLVLDWFAGLGTSLVAAQLLD